MRIFFAMLLMAATACNRQPATTIVDSNTKEDTIAMIQKKFRDADTVMLTAHSGRVNQGRSHNDTIPPVIINGRGSITPTLKKNGLPIQMR